MTIGEKLTKLRGDKTQKEIADAIGITVSALSNYENDYRTPKDEVKKKLCSHYNVSIEEIFFD